MSTHLPARAITACSVALLLVAVGCGKKKAETPAPQADLSQSMDLFQRPVPPAQVISPTTVVAKVDGYEVTGAELQNEMAMIVARERGRIPPERLAQIQPQLRAEALDRIIARRLLLSAIDRENVQVTPEEMAAARAELEAGLPPGMTLADALKQRNVTEEEFVRDYTSRLRVQKLMEQQTANVGEVTDADLQAFYGENREQFAQPEMVTARHILVAVDPQDTDEAKQQKKAKAEGIRARLVAGEDFATVAAAETDDPGSKESGGLYGPFPRGQMVPPFEEAAFTQAVGEIGPLVETRFGYHIIKVEKHDQPREVPLDEVRTNLAAFLRGRKMQAAAQTYIEGLRSNAQIDVTSGILP